MHKKFDHQAIEKKWQDKWRAEGLYETNGDSTKEKVYVLDMFPYPSGEGLHVGHPKGYIATDVYSRFKKMSGYEILHPMGWDAFGLPAENFAIKHKVHPRVAVEKNIANFKAQLAHLGFNYDWKREINTTDPEYYKWTQWIFLKLLEKGLAYESYEPINWCPGCQTGLANEDLESDGTCERCGSVVEKRPMRQWVLKITAYADRMLQDLDTLDWPEHIKEAQRNWIGRSEGAEIDFKLTSGESVKVFTTRPDTLFGATYLVLAPEHELVPKLPIENKSEAASYIQEAKQKTEIDRTNAGKEKTGVELRGIKAVNPANGEEIPVYIADYVLAHYGTGAIMAVPAHDERDGEFARKFGLPINQVVTRLYKDTSQEPTSDRMGVYALIKNEKNEYLVQHYVNKDFYWLPGGGLDEGESEIECLSREIKEETGYMDFSISKKVIEVLYDYESFRVNIGKATRNRTVIYEVLLNSSEQAPVNFTEDETKDGLVLKWLSEEEIAKLNPSLQKARIPLIVDAIKANSGRLITESGVLVHSGEFTGMDSEAAKKAIVEKVGGKLTNTYRLNDWVFSRQRYWGEPIPVIHCEKCGVVPVPYDQLPVKLPEVEHYEPTGTGESPLASITDWVNVSCPKCGGEAKRETNTMPQWAGSSWYYLRFIDPHNDQALIDPAKDKKWSPVDVYVGGDHAVRHLIYARFWHKFLYDIGSVHTIEPFKRLEFLGFILAEDGRKMSKRWGNIINPDDIVKQNGADTLRVYEMFMGPFENTVAWSTNGLVGAQRFVERVNGLAEHVKDSEPATMTTLLHKTIKKVREDIEAFKFNTAISTMMIYVNAAEKESLTKESYEAFLKVLAPFAPHLAEELWAEAGHTTSIHLEGYPEFDTGQTVDEEVVVGVQVNGKARGAIKIAPDATEEVAMAAAKVDPGVQKHLGDGVVDRVVYVPGRILNIVTKQ